MKILLALLALASTAHAAPLDDVIRDRLASQLPAGLGVAKVHLPASLPTEVEPDAVSIELPSELHVGRPSFKVSVRAHHKTLTAYVPVTLSGLVAVAVARHQLAAGSTIGTDEFTVEMRAIEGAAAAPASLVGATVTHDLAAGVSISAHDVSLPLPLARGTQVTIEIRHGAVHVRGTGELELAARPGEVATVRLAYNQTTLRGVLVAPATVVVGDAP